ncbi:hypothetical protein DNTS_002176 [Danionella cerebrum]|uniref:Septin-type G domain-containing protein n=1 Tax=Danionella cerebrum TaxID=2873325 RepID=A0A553N1Z1_9TELE|nr:hypothetical protein DNTS_002176 [Danionella translucida]
MKNWLRQGKGFRLFHPSSGPSECTVVPAAMEDSDREVDSASDSQDSMSASPEPRMCQEEKHFPKEDSEDSELEHIMGHHPPGSGHAFTPPRPPRAESDGPRLGVTPRDSEHHESRSKPQRGHVEFSLPSPISPSRPKSPWGCYDPYESAEDQDKEYVGFATLPNQVHRKSVKKGFDFTLMVADLYKDRKLLNAEERITQTVEITKHTVDIEEKGVKLKLTVVDTPGFGDAVNNTECWQSVADYIDEQFEQYFRDESGLNRKNIQDNRVHCCLYFISPFGHGLRPLDVEFMKALHEKVNIVPVLAKADTLTPAEIREEIEQYGIRIYQFPDCDSDEDEEFKQQDQELKESIPFAVIGSNTVVEAKGRRVRGRLYPWGIVEVENSAHCDFVKLRNMLVRTHMQDLKDVTRETHYENYRAHCIQSMTRMVVKERNRNSSKLTRESGTDFPIPLVSGAGDGETEKLIREKDEEVQHCCSTALSEPEHTLSEPEHLHSELEHTLPVVGHTLEAAEQTHEVLEATPEQSETEESQETQQSPEHLQA